MYEEEEELDDPDELFEMELERVEENNENVEAIEEEVEQIAAEELPTENSSAVKDWEKTNNEAAARKVWIQKPATARSGLQQARQQGPGMRNKQGNSTKGVQAGKKVARPRFTERELSGDKGLPALQAMFTDGDFDGDGRVNAPYAKLNLLLSRMECWAHNLYPPLSFDDFLEKTDLLGRKRLARFALDGLRNPNRGAVKASANGETKSDMSEGEDGEPKDRAAKPNEQDEAESMDDEEYERNFALFVHGQSQPHHAEDDSCSKVDGNGNKRVQAERPQQNTPDENKRPAQLVHCRRENDAESKFSAQKLAVVDHKKKKVAVETKQPSAKKRAMLIDDEEEEVSEGVVMASRFEQQSAYKGGADHDESSDDETNENVAEDSPHGNRKTHGAQAYQASASKRVILSDDDEEEGSDEVSTQRLSKCNDRVVEKSGQEKENGLKAGDDAMQELLAEMMPNDEELSD